MLTKPMVIILTLLNLGTNMAIPIKSIPELKGEVAKRFIGRANEAEKQKGTVDFSKQVEITNKILDKYYNK